MSPRYGLQSIYASGVGMMIILIVAATASAASWRTYHNTRFGATGDVPSNWKMLPAPMNNDGRAFKSPNGKAIITISGIFSTSLHAEEIADRLKSGDSETITSSSSDKTHVRVDGTSGAKGFVRVSILSCSGKIWNDLDISYPLKDWTSLRPTIDHAVASFHAGRGYDMSC
jgi:hypothetical protein